MHLRICSFFIFRQLQRCERKRCGAYAVRYLRNHSGPGSPLYSQQKELVASLGKRNVKERFEKVEIYLMACGYSKMEYKVFVYEDVAIQYPDKDFVTKSFNWCYTVNNESGVYKLSAIENWQ